MKKTVLFLLAMLVAAVVAARPVDSATARRVAEVYLQAQGMRNTAALVDVTAETPFTEFYLFAAPEGGFVLVSGDDCVVPILGYSAGNRFVTKDIPEQVAGWLSDYEKEIRHWRTLETAGNWRASDEVRLQWDMLSDGVMPPMPKSKSVSDTLTVKWDQTPYYNLYCPHDVNSSTGRVPTGCVATAMGQVMKYWNWPETGYLDYGYTHANYGWQYADFGATTYLWDSMPLQLNAFTSGAQDSAVALLLYHCGVSVDMIYGPHGSGAAPDNGGVIDSASQENSLIKYFKYSPAVHSVYLADFNLSEWCALLAAEIDGGRPVLYSGTSPAGGHAFVLDGYNSDGYFHVNWGWSGHYDGFFPIGGLNLDEDSYNTHNVAVVGIQPNYDWGTGGTVTVNTNDSIGGTVPPPVSYSFGDTLWMWATPNLGYHFKCWSDGSTYINRWVLGTGGDLEFTADFEPVGTDTLIMYGGGGERIIHTLGWPSYGEYTWGVMYDSTFLPTGRELHAVEFYAIEEGIYDLSVYLGTANDTSRVYTTSFTVDASELKQWKSVEVGSPVVVDGWESMWVMFHKVGTGWPAALTSYGGISESFVYEYRGGFYADGARTGCSAMVRSMLRPTTSAPAPRVYVHGTEQIAVGGTATFTATGTPGLTVNWTFPGGNPATATGNVASSTYNTPGIHQAIASITFDGVTVSDTALVVVVDYTVGDTISYCLDRPVVMWGGNTDTTTWGIMLPAEYLQGRYYLADVLLFTDIEGTYTLHVYQGGTDSPSVETYTRSFVVDPFDQGFYLSFTPDRVVSIDTTQNLWIVFGSNADEPANYCDYVGEPNSDWIYSDDDGGWVRVHEAFPGQSMTWLIKAVTSKTEPQTGIGEVETDGIALYPNPASEKLTVSVTEPGEVRVMDVMGRIVLQKQVTAGANTLDVGALPAGVYYLKSGSSHASFIINR